MADKEFKIKISTQADTSGAKQVTQALGESAQAATKDAGATDEQGKKTGFLNLRKAELKKLTRELGHEFPIAGMAVKALMNPLVFGLTLAIGLFAKAKQSLDDWNKELDATAARNAETFGNLGDEIRNVRREMSNAGNSGSRDLKKIADAEREIGEQTDKATDAIKRQERAQIALTDAQEALELAEVDSQRKLHDVDPSKGLDEGAALRREIQIKANAENRRNAIQDQAEQAEITNKSNRLNNDIMEQHRLKKTVDDGGAGEVLRRAKIKDSESQISKAETAKKAADDDVAKQSKILTDTSDRLAELQKGIKEAGSISQGEIYQVHKLEKDVAAATTKLKDLEGNQKRTGDALETAKSEKEKFTLEQKNYEDAKAALEKINEVIRQLTGQIDGLMAVAKENAGNRAQLAAIHQATNSTSAAGQMIQGSKNGQLPPGVVIGKDGSPNIDPKSLPGYVPASLPRYVFPSPPKPAPEMSADEVDRRSDSPPGTTATRRAQEAADREAAQARARELREQQNRQPQGASSNDGAHEQIKSDTSQISNSQKQLTGAFAQYSKAVLSNQQALLQEIKTAHSDIASLQGQLGNMGTFGKTH
ncbi:MAG: hypothetical protein JWR26_4847 [Pedosphaera sp.]|nr:hypothetical protein [Pedosphaera sp.]